MGTSDARVTDQERSRTLAEGIAEVLWGRGMTASKAVAYNDARSICANLDTNPDEPLDGPLVVLHPGQHVVEWQEDVRNTTVLTEWRDEPKQMQGWQAFAWVVVASNPQERP